MTNRVVSKLYRTMAPQGVMNELGSVAAAMSRNPAFMNAPGNVPTAAMLLEMREKFGTAIEAAQSHDSNKIKERNELHREAVALLDVVAKYLEMVAISNPSVLNDPGFTQRPPSKKKGLLAAPLGFSVYHGPHPGTVTASVNNMSTVHTWEIHFAEGDPAPEQNWGIDSVHVDHTSMVMTARNTSANVYYRIRGLNRAGAGAWSPPVPLPPRH